MPKEVAQLYDLVAANKWREAQDLHYKLMPLNDAVFLEINPVPVKSALGMMGKIAPEVRLPLAPLSKENENKLRAILVSYGLIS
jgi:4-hydroxy-tetrahydrodipicolinate synthase